MALSDIFREPRQEITRCVVGLVAIGGLVWGDYVFAMWLEEYAGYRANNHSIPEIPWFMGMLIGAVGGMGIIALLILANGLGEVVCDWLQDHT